MVDKIKTAKQYINYIIKKDKEENNKDNLTFFHQNAIKMIIKGLKAELFNSGLSSEDYNDIYYYANEIALLTEENNFHSKQTSIIEDLFDKQLQIATKYTRREGR